MTKFQAVRIWVAILPMLVITETQADPGNPNIDMTGFLKVAAEAAAVRAKHRISENEFLEMRQKPGTIVLDARSAEKFNILHVDGAINLSFPDIDVVSLARVLRTKALGS